MTKGLWMLLLILPCSAASLHAQVAAPSLFPPMPRIVDPITEVPQTTMVPENPAAMEWGPSTSGGTAALKSKRQVDSGEEDTFNGLMVGALVRSELYSANVTLIDYFAEEFSLLLVKAGGSANLGRVLAVGAASDQFFRTVKEDQQQIETLTAGISLNLGDTLYLGAAGATDDRTDKQGSGLEPIEYTVSRQVRKYGVALVLGDRDHSMLHLETFRIAKDEYKLQEVEFGGSETTGLTLETKIGSLVLGASALSMDQATAQKKTDGQFLDIGWEPRKISIKTYLHVERFVTTYDDGVEIINSTQALVVGYAF